MISDRQSRLRHWLAAGGFLLLVLLCAGAAPLRGAGVEFEGPDEEITTSGYLTLRWALVDEAATSDSSLFQVHVEGARVAGKEIVYEGPETQSFLSGLPDGEYRFRVRHRGPTADAWGGWSDTKIVTVSHHSLQFAMTLFVIGGIVFVLTAGFILRNRNADVHTGGSAEGTTA